METRTEVLREEIEKLQERLAPQVEEVKARVRAANHSALTFIQERPLTCLVGALAIGYVVGRVVRAKG